MCFIDFKKAFHLVNHMLLFVKLAALVFGGDRIEWVWSFRENSEFRITVEGEVSDWTAAPSDVPHASVLGSILFVYTSTSCPRR